jgi:hypothetical protein
MKRLFILLTVCLGIFCEVARAQEVGIDLLGIKSRHWDCEAMLRAVRTLAKPIPFGAFIDSTFGDDDSCIIRLLETGKVSQFRGHFKWNNNHALAPASSLVPTAIKFNGWAKRFSHIKFRPSATCEHWAGEAESAAVHNALNPYLTDTDGWIDSGQRAYDRRATREVHGNRKPPAGTAWISQDGGDDDANGVFDVDTFEHRKKAREAYLEWDTSLNCKFSNKDRRAARDRTDCPTQDEFYSMIRLTYPRPAYPGHRRLDGGRIWKPYSDNHGGTPRNPKGCQGKDCKGLLITLPFKDKKGRVANPNTLKIYAQNGAHIDTLQCFVLYNNCNDPRNWLDGIYPRYYSKKTSFWIGQQAEIVSGSPFISIDEGRARYVVYPYGRDGAMR